MRRQQRQDERAHEKINRKMSQALVKDDFQLTDVYDNMESTITFGEQIADAVPNMPVHGHSSLSFPVL